MDCEGIISATIGSECDYSYYWRSIAENERRQNNNLWRSMGFYELERDLVEGRW